MRKASRKVVWVSERSTLNPPGGRPRPSHEQGRAFICSDRQVGACRAVPIPVGKLPSLNRCERSDPSRSPGCPPALRGGGILPF